MFLYALYHKLNKKSIPYIIILINYIYIIYTCIDIQLFIIIYVYIFEHVYSYIRVLNIYTYIYLIKKIILFFLIINL
nr:MAG TPA: hypothetical protein [Caudoviricetes sp.]